MLMLYIKSHEREVIDDQGIKETEDFGEQDEFMWQLSKKKIL